MNKLSPIRLVAVLDLAVALCGHFKATAAAVSDVLTQALNDRNDLPAAVGSLWRFEGPRNLQAGFITGFGLSPHSGRINEIAIHPSDPLIMYVTGAIGGAWKTTDGGRTWAARSKGWPIQSATAIAIDPNNGNRVFVGTGDYKRADHVPPFSVGIMRSLDGGLSWSQFGTAEMREFTVSRIVIDPSNSQNVLAATGRGSRLPGGQIFRSTDGGVNWSAATDSAGNPLPDANWDDLELCGGHIFWASATRRHALKGADPGGANGLLFQSPDGGATWSKVNLRVPGGFDLDTVASRPETIQIACLPGSSLVFVAVYENNAARVFVTPDAGANWAERSSLQNYPVPVSDGPWAHAAFGVTANFVYVAGTDMFRGGFVEGVGFVFSPLPGPALHTDFQCVVPDPTETDAVFFGCDGGLYRHSAQSASSVSLSATLGVTQVYRMDVHKRHGGLIAIGTQDLGDSVSFFGNGNDAAALTKSPVWALVVGGDGRSAAFRNDNSSRVYLANTSGGIVRYDGSTRIGLQNAATAENGQAPLLYRSSVDTLNYADTDFSQLLNPETKDNALGTADWMSFQFRAVGTKPTIQSLAVCPTDAGVIYAGSLIGELFYSEDGGATWTELDRTGLPDAPIWAISPSPSNCRDVLVGVGYDSAGVSNGSNTFEAGDRLFRKTDVLAAGAWSGVHGGPPPLPHAPVFAITRVSSAPNSRWFVAGDVGIFRTGDGGLHWANATSPLGLPNTLARDLRLSADGNRLYAGTFGRGVWSMDVNPPADAFGVRGIVTQAGRPVSGARVAASGAGRIMKFLKNTLTTGTIPTTAPIEVTGSATISSVAALVTAVGAESAFLVTPSGDSVPMSVVLASGTGTTFLLSSSDAATLVGRATAGGWSFKVAGQIVLRNGVKFRITPSIQSGVVDLRFTDGVSEITAPDGEYTLEYLNRGSHSISIPFTNCGKLDTPCQRAIDLQSNRTGLDFQVVTIGEFVLEPSAATVAVHDQLNYQFTWTVPDPLNWHDLNSLQLRIRDATDTIFWVSFDEASKTFSLVNPATGQLEKGFAAGSRNSLQTPQATLHLADTSVVGSGPTGPSVTLNLALSFKPSAAGRTFLVEVAATDDLGNQDNFAAAGTVTVAPIQ
jgi:photosystem II stability/assembly factor-like uncharacterized protein